MNYRRYIWLHDFEDEPNDFYSEFDDDRWETRKVWIYKDGRMKFADQAFYDDIICLTPIPMPPDRDYCDADLTVTTINQEEFECVWIRATRNKI